MALKRIDIPSYLGYTVSAVTFIFGVIILSGLAFQYIPVEMRIMFGVVMVLMGIYRFVLTRTKIRQKSEGEEE